MQEALHGNDSEDHPGFGFNIPTLCVDYEVTLGNLQQYGGDERDKKGGMGLKWTNGIKRKELAKFP